MFLYGMLRAALANGRGFETVWKTGKKDIRRFLVLLLTVVTLSPTYTYLVLCLMYGYTYTKTICHQNHSSAKFLQKIAFDYILLSINIEKERRIYNKTIQMPVPMQSSDEVIDSLMGELWAQQGYSDSAVPLTTQDNLVNKHQQRINSSSSFKKRQLSELSGYPDNHHMAGNHSIWNPYVSVPLTTGVEKNRLLGPLPTNPQVEMVRRRAFEKFKQDCTEIIQRVLGSYDLKLPIPSILEKWHMDSKLAETVPTATTRQKKQGGGVRTTQRSDLYPPISSTEEIYRLIVTDPNHVTRNDPILLGKQASDLIQAVLQPEVEKAWAMKQSVSQDRVVPDRKPTDAVLLQPPKMGKKLQHIKKAIHRCICEAEEMFHRQLRQSKEQQTRLQNENKRGRQQRKLPKITRNDETDQYHVTYAGVTLRLHVAYYEKLQRLFDRAYDTTMTTTTTTSDGINFDSFDESLYALLCRYDMLQGAGLQAGVPGRVMDTLLLHFDCRMECFASPLNCRYEHFASAFDLDRQFGSYGSFFDLDDEFFFTDGGCFEANPPFCEGVMNALDDRIRQLLKKSPKPLMFIVFVPAWKDSHAYKEGLLKNPFLEKHVLLPSGKHYYAEGTQHRRKGSFRPASFDSSILFYQDDAAKVKWPIGSKVIEDLTSAFCDDPGKMDKVSSNTFGQKKTDHIKNPVMAPKNETTKTEVDDVLLDKKSSKKRKDTKEETTKKNRAWMTDSRDGESHAQLDLLESLGLSTTTGPTSTTTTSTVSFSESRRSKQKRRKKTA